MHSNTGCRLSKWQLKPLHQMLTLKLFLNVTDFNVWLPNGEKRKMKGRRGRELVLKIIWKSLHPERKGLAIMGWRVYNSGH